MAMTPTEFGKKPTVDAIWSILDTRLHLVFKRNELGDVMFPFIVLRRMDSMLEPVNDNVRDMYRKFYGKVNDDKLDPILRKAAGGLHFYNTSRFTLKSLLDDAPNIATNFMIYINSYNSEVQDILKNFYFDNTVAKLIRNNLLYKLIQSVCEYDFRVETVDNHEMGTFFEEIIRLANENSNETAGEHFTPRDAIHLMSAIMFEPDARELRRSDIIRTIYDPTCGTGGMVNIGKKYILDTVCRETDKPTIRTYGQELNETAYAVAKSEALITEADTDSIRLGDTLVNDLFPHKTFDYIMANPPYGINWAKEKDAVTSESFDPNGRFYAGLPKVSDGQLLFMQHMIHHMAANGKVGIVTNGSPLFSGGADSGESNIRKWIIENDWLDCIIALPKDLFYNTGIATYIWILNRRKTAERKGKLQLINAASFYHPALKSLGSKRNDIRQDNIDEILRLYMEFKENKFSRIFRNEDFGYLQLTIEQPKRKEDGSIELKAKKPVADSSKRDSTERVTLDTDVPAYFEKEILPHIDQESWIDYSKTKIGYEINFTQYFYEFKQGDSAADIRARIMDQVDESTGLTRQQTIQQLLSMIFDEA